MLSHEEPQISNQIIIKPITYLGKAFIILLVENFGDTISPATPYSYSQVTDSLKNPSSVTKQLYHYFNIINMIVDETFNDIHSLSNIANNDLNDVFYLHQAMILPDAEKFIEATKKEIVDHNRGKH